MTDDGGLCHLLQKNLNTRLVKYFFSHLVLCFSNFYLKFHSWISLLLRSFLVIIEVKICTF
ncbi:hypothetical protein F383_25753 [Gossypium arboreum]|uniref:Uncharacterized protein n=1 Tax=Gossypium arboreum TaxID=29729 RepID=A0A0B0MTT1_GOSAR|nr:hypothetical protein F383_25753 [Gossypium arboreum]